MRKKTPEVPTKMMSTPARAGPRIRVAFMDELISDMPFMSLFWGMMSETVACRLGMLNAISEPLMSPETSTCHSSITPARSSSPTTRVNAAFPACVYSIIRLREMRSASAPPIGEMRVIGSANVTITKASASGESSASFSTSQLLVIHCMFMPRYEVRALAQSQRKSE